MPLTEQAISTGELELLAAQATMVATMATSVSEMVEGTDKANAIDTLRRAFYGLSTAGRKLRRENLAQQAARPGGKDGTK